MNRNRPLMVGTVALLILMAAACSSDSTQKCESAPSEVVSGAFGSSFTVSPETLVSGGPVEFYLRSIEGGSGEMVVGYGATWECWAGDAFVATHLLEFGSNTQGVAIEGLVGSTTTAPAIAYPIPAAFASTVPEVEPGWYRLRIDYHEGQGVSHVNLLMVEVVE